MKNVINVLVVFSLVFLASDSYAQKVAKSTLSDQLGVEVTVYNNNLGLVKDTRKIDLPTGEGELQFMDVAARIIPVTVKAISVNAPEDFAVLEQNYEYDLITPTKLLDKYVGKKLKLMRVNQYQDTKEIVEAELLSNNDGKPIYKINDEIYLGYEGSVILPEIPENLIAKPTLTWMYSNKSKLPHELEVSYLTERINWKADYVVVLNKTDDASDISGWVTIDNKSGTTYKDASLKLIAGEVQRAQREKNKIFREYALDEMVGAAAPQFEEKAFFEYHTYDLQRKTTIKDRQTKQIRLIEASGVNMKKEFLVYGIQSYYTRRYQTDKPKQPVNIYVSFKNAKDNNMGIPLPEGIMRLYKKDSEGKLQFIGENKIEHTPKNEEVEIKIGEAFDVVAERIQTDYRQLTTKLHETEWEVAIRNHKDEDIVVGIIEPLYGNWKVISNTHPYKKKDAFTIRFDVPVKKDSEAKVRYRVRVGI